MRNMNRIRGSLIGGAVGDALGYAVEFCNESKIFEKYPGGIKEFELTNGKGIISDDTQMTLFTAVGVIKGVLEGEKNNTGRVKHIYKALLEWLKTQSPYNDEWKNSECWLCKIPQLCVQRAPGNTCLTALMSGNCGSINERITQSCGCGGVMRVSPIGLYYGGGLIPQDEADLLAAESAAITHGHDLGFIPASGLSHIVSKLAYYECDNVFEAVNSAIDAIKRLFDGFEGTDRMVQLLEKAKLLANSNTDVLDSIHTLGEGWVGDEALAIAVYCALKFGEDFEGAICAAVNHGGDSDSTGSVCGNIVGALVGLEGIPRKYLGKLELCEEILELADDLFYARLLTAEEFLGGDRQRKKYGVTE